MHPLPKTWLSTAFLGLVAGGVEDLASFDAAGVADFHHGAGEAEFALAVAHLLDDEAVAQRDAIDLGDGGEDGRRGFGGGGVGVPRDRLGRLGRIA